MERVQITILNGVRTLLCQTGLPSTFWAEPASYTVYCRNRSRNSKGHNPEKLGRQKPADYGHLQPFGANLYFGDYVEGTINYRIWDLERQKVHHTRDVVFSKSPNMVLQNFSILQNFGNLQNGELEEVTLVDDSVDTQPLWCHLQVLQHLLHQ